MYLFVEISRAFRGKRVLFAIVWVPDRYSLHSYFAAVRRRWIFPHGGRVVYEARNIVCGYVFVSVFVGVDIGYRGQAKQPCLSGLPTRERERERERNRACKGCKGEIRSNKEWRH
jgi:hypothetical protein